MARAIATERLFRNNRLIEKDEVFDFEGKFEPGQPFVPEAQAAKSKPEKRVRDGSPVAPPWTTAGFLSDSANLLD